MREEENNKNNNRFVSPHSEITHDNNQAPIQENKQKPEAEFCNIKMIWIHYWFRGYITIFLKQYLTIIFLLKKATALAGWETGEKAGETTKKGTDETGRKTIKETHQTKILFLTHCVMLLTSSWLCQMYYMSLINWAVRAFSAFLPVLINKDASHTMRQHLVAVHALDVLYVIQVVHQIRTQSICIGELLCHRWSRPLKGLPLQSPQTRNSLINYGVNHGGCCSCGRRVEWRGKLKLKKGKVQSPFPEK